MLSTLKFVKLIFRAHRRPCLETRSETGLFWGRRTTRVRLLSLGVPTAWKAPRLLSARAFHMGMLLGSLYISVLGRLGAHSHRGGTVAETTPPEPRGCHEVKWWFAGVPGAQEMVHLFPAGDCTQVSLSTF